MKRAIHQILLCIMFIIPVMSSAQYTKTSGDVSFRSGSDILVDTYSSNASTLSRIDTVIRENKNQIISNSAYIQLVAGISPALLSDKFALNIASIQASVVKTHLRKKYGLNDNHFAFCFDENIKANTIQITFHTKSTPKRGSANIFFTSNKTSSTDVNAAIARYGTNIPISGRDTSTTDPKSSVSTQTTSQPSSNIAKEHTDNYSIDFRYGSETLYAAYLNNKRVLEALKSDVINSRSPISEHRQHIRIVSIIPKSEKGNIAAINFASIRGAVVRKWIRDNFSWLSESDFSFYISADRDRNAVEVSIIDSPIEDKHKSDIFFSLDKGYPEKVDYAVARYKRIPFLDGSEMFERTGMDFKIIDPALDPTITKTAETENDEQIIVTIYYRWDKDNLDKTYITNAQTLSQVDSLLHLKSADYIDSLRIVAYASPEGPPDYNKRLSQRRANTLKNYLLSTYPRLREEQIVTVARGENWDGFRRMAQADPNLPMKEQVLSIINNPSITDLQRQSQIAKLDGGRLYKNYILPNYYRYLRTGASLFLVYKPVTPDFEPIEVVITEPEPEPILIIKPKPIPVTKYPLALRTNLLYDAIGAINLGIEIPIKEHWSLIIDGAYSYWRSPKNLYALQTLEYGMEARYWFGVSESRKAKNSNWAKPLKGWNVGVYGRYWQRYDAQWIDGYQGDDTWSAGLTAGYAFPIGKQLAFEASIGAGWISTSEYRHYHQPEYDENGKYHLMWQETGIWSGLSITKVRFSLVWLIEFRKKGGRK